MASSSTSGNVDVTHEELERISKALKDEKFRQLFCEYAQEISDPENKKKYEEEIAQMERNRGSDVVFVHPEPGYVIKTNVDGECKAFINVCKSDKVRQPTSTNVRRENGQMGAKWSIPHSLASGREDLDKGGKKCTVYDCVFHPDCFKNAEKDKRFIVLMDDTAMNSIETNFSVKLDRENMKKLTKLKFKGQPRPAVIRTKSKIGPSGETDALKDFNVDYPYKDIDQKDKDKNTNPPAKSSTKISGTRNTKTTSSKNDVSGPVEPKYSIIHRGHFDIQHFTNAPDSMPTTRPQELVIKIQLPLLKSIATVQLDVSEKQIVLECHKPASYKLSLALPYPVDEDKGNAKFDKSKSCLTITLPVLPPEIPKVPSFAPEPQNVPLIEDMSQSSTSTEAISGEHMEPVGETIPAAVEDKTELSEQAIKEVSSEVEQSKPITDNNGVDHVHTEVAQTHDVQQREIIGPQNSSIDTTHTSKASLSDEPTASENEQCPSYIFRQDDLTVSFVLQVANIDSSSLTEHISDNKSTVSLKFRSITNMSGAIHEAPYSFCVVFRPQCQVENMDIDVQTTEAVLLLHKAASFHGEWPGFRAGLCLADLEEKLFLTEENVREHLDTMTRKRKGKRQASSGSGSDVDCGVIEASEDKLVIELESKGNGDAPGEISDATLGRVTDTVADTVIDAVIGELSSTAASLNLDPKHDDLSPTSDVSCPSTPCSPSGLRSAMRDSHHGYREHRSVSFSEDVVVETVVSSGSPRKAKGRNKRHHPPRPRRFITKLRDGSQNQGTYSDSEVQYRGKGRKEEEEEEIFSEEVVFPDWVCLDRQTSSDSSGGETGTTALEFSNKKKKPKANKRQRRKMTDAKRARAYDDDNSGMQDAWFGPQYPLRNTSSEGSLSTSGSHIEKPNSKKSPSKKDQNQGPRKKHVDNQVPSKPEDETGKGEDEKNSPDIQNSGNPDKTTSKMSETEREIRNDKCEEENISQEIQLDNIQERFPSKTESETVNVVGNDKDESIPLEMQDHRTQSAVNFSNEVMFELDE